MAWHSSIHHVLLSLRESVISMYRPFTVTVTSASWPRYLSHAVSVPKPMLP